MGSALAQAMPELPAEPQAAAQDAGHPKGSGKKVPELANPDHRDAPEFIPSDELIEHFGLSREKFARAMVAGGLAGSFRLFYDLLMGRLKGKDLLDALQFIEKKWGLPTFTESEIAASKQASLWAERIEEKGWSIDGLRDALKGKGKKGEGNGDG